MLRQKPACSCHQSYMRWINAVYMATDQPTLPWPSHRFFSPNTSAMTLLKNSRHLWYQSCLTLCLLEAARSPTKKLRERRKSIEVYINSGNRVEKTLVLPLPPALIAELGKTCSRSCISTVARKGTTRGSALSPEKTCQKTSISLGNLRSDD